MPNSTKITKALKCQIFKCSKPQFNKKNGLCKQHDWQVSSNHIFIWRDLSSNQRIFNKIKNNEEEYINDEFLEKFDSTVSFKSANKQNTDSEMSLEISKLNNKIKNLKIETNKK